jgi:hypothetical protein
MNEAHAKKIGERSFVITTRHEDGDDVIIQNNFNNDIVYILGWTSVVAQKIIDEFGDSVVAIFRKKSEADAS